jgi:hypothetical protein
MRSQQQPAEILRTSVIACASKYLHEHGLGDGERAVGGDQLRHPPIHAAARRPIELHAGRGVGEDHAAPRGAPSSGTSPHGSRAAHGQRLIAAHRLTGQVPQREVIPERPGIVIAEAELAPQVPRGGRRPQRSPPGVTHPSPRGEHLAVPGPGSARRCPCDRSEDTQGSGQQSLLRRAAVGTPVGGSEPSGVQEAPAGRNRGHRGPGGGIGGP